MRRAAFVIPLLLSAIAFAKVDKEAGKTLYDGARKLSDIRADGAPAFHLEANFKITQKASGKEINGRYSEIWISKAKWRRDVETDSFHRIEIGAAPLKWVSDSGKDRPESAFYEPLVLLFPKNSTLDVRKILERQAGGVNATCVESKTEGSKGVDCVDPKAGVFLLREAIAGFDRVLHSCVYENYEKFGDRLFPRTVRCNNSSVDEIVLTVTKLEAQPQIDDSLFSKPQNAIETANCQGHSTPPQALYSPGPEFPKHHSPAPESPQHPSENTNETVVLQLTVATDGIPRDVRVTRTAGRDFDEPALGAFQRWRFKPSTCDGVPVPAQINVEINFRRF